MSKIFSAKDHFDNYLEKVGLKGKKIPVDQYREMKRAFYGGLGSCVVFFTADIDQLSEEEAIQEIEKFTQEIADYWKTQITKG